MVCNTQVAADHHAPPVTQILAGFVANHPGLSGGWSDAGPRGAPHLHELELQLSAPHEAADAAVAAVMFCSPRPRPRRLAVKGRHRLRAGQRYHAHLRL
jgi:hypothetical protein